MRQDPPTISLESLTGADQRPRAHGAYGRSTGEEDPYLRIDPGVSSCGGPGRYATSISHKHLVIGPINNRQIGLAQETGREV